MTPYASGAFFVDGQLTVVGSDPDYAGRSRRIVGLLVDRDFGGHGSPRPSGGAVGVATQAWVAAEAVWGDLTWIVNLQDTSNPLYRAWTTALPDYLDVTPTTWVLHWIWTAAGVAAAVVAFRRERRRTVSGVPDPHPQWGRTLMPHAGRRGMLSP